MLILIFEAAVFFVNKTTQTYHVSLSHTLILLKINAVLLNSPPLFPEFLPSETTTNKEARGHRHCII